MRYTHQWHRPGECGDEHCLGGWAGTVNPKLHHLVRDKLDHLTREEQLLLFQEIACIAEGAYRRGFQQGHYTADLSSPFRSPTQSELHRWRYDIPLELAAPPPGHVTNEEEVYADLDRFASKMTSAERLSIDGGNASPITDELVGLIGRGDIPELKELWGPGGDTMGTLREDD